MGGVLAKVWGTSSAATRTLETEFPKEGTYAPLPEALMAEADVFVTCKGPVPGSRQQIETSAYVRCVVTLPEGTVIFRMHDGSIEAYDAVFERLLDSPDSAGARAVTDRVKKGGKFKVTLVSLLEPANKADPAVVVHHSATEEKTSASVAVKTDPAMDKIEAFAKDVLSKYDDSHGWSHIEAVWVHAQDIARSYIDPVARAADRQFQQELQALVYLHDVLDHKYKDVQPPYVYPRTLFVLENAFGQARAEALLRIIDNFGFTREAQGKRDKFDTRDTILLQIVSDADRLDALGARGLLRCETFNVIKLQRRSPQQYISEAEVQKAMIQHCHDKLLRLLPEGFFKTERGRELARPLHQQVVDYVQRYESSLGQGKT
jgi:uncharacterized protein